MCLWPPAKISASCMETDGPSSHLERGRDEHRAEGDTSPPPIQLVGSLCDITKGWLTHWARWQRGETAFSSSLARVASSFTAVASEASVSEMWNTCCARVCCRSFAVFLPLIRTIRAVVLLRIPRPTHNSPSVEASLIRRMWSWEHLHHVTVTRLSLAKLMLSPERFPLRSAVSRHHRGGSVLSSCTEIKVLSLCQIIFCYLLKWESTGF